MRIEVKNTHCTMSLECEENNFIPLQDLLCALERAVIGEMLDANNGIKAKAAGQLMLNRTTLVEKARKYGFPLKGK